MPVTVSSGLKFVTLRKENVSEVSYNIVHGATSELGTQLEAASSALNSNTQKTSLADAYINSSKFVKADDLKNTIFNKAFYVLKENLNETVDKIPSLLLTTIPSIKDALDSAENKTFFSKLNDSILALVVAYPNNNELLNLVQTGQLVNLLTDFEKNRSKIADKTIRAALYRYLNYPNSLFKKAEAKLGQTTPPPTPPAPKEPIKKEKNAREELEKAYNELSKVTNSDVELKGTILQPKENFISNLSAETKKVFQQYAGDNKDIKNVLEKVESEYKVISKDEEKVVRKIQRVGDTLVEIVPNEVHTQVAALTYGTESPGPAINYGMVADLYVIKHRLKGYALGEVANIENVLKGEKKEASVKSTKIVEESVLRSLDKETYNSDELQTNERFMLEMETRKTLENESEFQMGASISGTYGFVTAAVNVGYNGRTSSEESERAATNFSREVTQKAVNRITENVKEQTSKKSTDQVEQLNARSFDNSVSPTANVTGVYRWVDKVYSTYVKRYDSKLVFEFLLPEPAALFLEASTSSSPMTSLKKPDDFTYKASDITPLNYLKIAAQYGVGLVDPPPALDTWVSKILQIAPEQDKGISSVLIEVPKDHEAVVVYTTGLIFPTETSSEDPNVRVSVGSDIFNLVYGQFSDQKKTTTLSGVRGTFPVAVQAFFTRGYSITFQVYCLRTAEALENWRIKTYAALLEGYERQLSAYNDELNAATIRSSAIAAIPESSVKSLVMGELRRGIISLLVKNKIDTDLINSDPTDSLPEIDLTALSQNASDILFFENSFDWGEMTYEFLPYFWARRGKWKSLLQPSGRDPLLEMFLKAGGAKVRLFVRSGYENHVLHFMQFNRVWSGTTPPQVGSAEWAALGENVSNGENLTEDITEENSQFDIQVPTSMIMLQEDSSLPQF